MPNTTFAREPRAPKLTHADIAAHEPPSLPWDTATDDEVWAVALRAETARELRRFGVSAALCDAVRDGRLDAATVRAVDAATVRMLRVGAEGELLRGLVECLAGGDLRRAQDALEMHADCDHCAARVACGMRGRCRACRGPQ